MYKPIYIFIGLRYLWNSHLPIFKKIITIFSISSISLGIFSMIMTVSVINGCQYSFKKNFLSFIPHLIITNKNQKINKLNFPKNILQSENIEKFSDFINSKVIIKNKNIINIADMIGIDSNNCEFLNNYNIKNVLPTLFLEKKNIIIGKELAKNLHVNINDTISLIYLPTHKKELFEKSFKTKTFKITGIFSTNNEIDYYQILINKNHALNFLHYSKNLVTGWRIWLKDPFSSSKIKNLKNDLILLDWKTEKGEFFKMMKVENYMMLFFLILILLIVICNVIIIFTINVIDKKNIIAIFQSQGLSNKKIALIFIILALSTSIIGSIIGTTMSVILIMQKKILDFIIHLFFSNVKIPINIQLHQIFLINIVFIFFSIISIIYPTCYIIKRTTYKVLSDE
ncbi:lipoprotein-releasing system transmembrane subunit LolC [Buchnera aphidicola (Melanaphis sacchari)]|uniref:Lipoprotein-releasing system transmembrane subunit LolC n=1 Tax=Buchnera aphidicola (Melanaphis sacchari) TaxID=2173854 RepID=A0A2U8DGW1_9GAMM|nr:FtsX-like permease family protein [Buchnera aphidicola]AWH90494.1 lipoprotein-releasing system transmembrane subunit LolC [Buchnera aphidicola (Melanaphis sacchari)]